ncbi:MAG: CoA-binding protein [Candidatus Helarchaeota archaeon]
MDENNKLYKQIDKFFHPESVAIVGESSRSGFFWIRNLTSINYMGKIYPINPKYKSALGIKFFPSILDVPDRIDNVIIAVPRDIVLDTVKQCIEKEVNVCVIFSSGFSETGTVRWIELENKLKELIQGTNTRILGPNCLGFYCPESGVSFRPDFPVQSGDVAFISQSGGNAISLGLRCSTFRLYFSKMVSFGNAIDLTAADFINYFRLDKKTKYIGMYIEGPKNGYDFFESIRKTTPIKPIIILKGGLTERGAKAAASHTGAISSSIKIWNSMIKQSGAIPVYSFDELVETLLTFHYCRAPLGRNVGLLSVSGGSSVINTDACVKVGLNVPLLSDETVYNLKKIVQSVGINIKNPIDLAGSYFDLRALRTALSTLGEDKNIDSIIIEVAIQYIYMTNRFGIDDFPEIFYKTILNEIKTLRKKSHFKKPILVAFPPTTFEEERIWDRLRFIKRRIPAFHDVASAARALSHLCWYKEFYESITKKKENS